MTKQILQQKIAEAVRKLQETGELSVSDLPEIRVERPKDEQFGEYTTNIALVLAKSSGKPPREIAEHIKENLSIPNVEAINVAGPGHLNFVFSDVYFREALTDVLSEKETVPGKKEKIMVEYSQPNTHKEFEKCSYRLYARKRSSKSGARRYRRQLYRRYWNPYRKMSVGTGHVSQG